MLPLVLVSLSLFTNFLLGTNFVKTFSLLAYMPVCRLCSWNYFPLFSPTCSQKELNKRPNKNANKNPIPRHPNLYFFKLSLEKSKAFSLRWIIPLNKKAFLLFLREKRENWNAYPHFHCLPYSLHFKNPCFQNFI